MVATRTIRDDLERRGFVNVKPWSRGVDTELFRPDHPPALDLPRPVYLYVGRVAVEKNLEAFLDVPLARGSKLVVGDGPALERLEAKHPEVHFAGARHGIELARHYAWGDVFVFPSRTDTFGLVLLEALASGLPVAAYPVPGPLDVIGDSGCGVLDQDLGRAMAQALAIPRARCANMPAASPGAVASSSFSAICTRSTATRPVVGALASRGRPHRNRKRPVDFSRYL